MLHNEIDNYSFKWLPRFPVASELINCRHIGDKAYLYRPTQITERFSIFFISG